MAKQRRDSPPFSRSRGPESPFAARPSLPTPDALIALDQLCWLGSGRDVAARMNCNPSTVSRKAEACAVSLGLLLRKRSGLWTLFGPGELLQAERQLHQRYRLAGYGPLRLDVAPDLSDLLADPPHPAWQCGGQGHFACRRPLELLEQRVIDGWLCSFCEELPPLEPASCQVLELAVLPLLLLAHAEHALARSANAEELDAAALRDCLCLVLPDHCQPQRQARLRRLGLDNRVLPLERHDPGKWDGPLEDHRTVRPGTPFDLLQRPDWRPLPLSIDHQTRLGLVVRSDLVEETPVQELHQALSRWIAGLPLPSAVVRGVDGA